MLVFFLLMLAIHEYEGNKALTKEIKIIGAGLHWDEIKKEEKWNRLVEANRVLREAKNLPNPAEVLKAAQNLENSSELLNKFKNMGQETVQAALRLEESTLKSTIHTAADTPVFCFKDQLKNPVPIFLVEAAEQGSFQVHWHPDLPRNLKVTLEGLSVTLGKSSLPQFLAETKSLVGLKRDGAKCLHWIHYRSSVRLTAEDYPIQKRLKQQFYVRSELK